MKLLPKFALLSLGVAAIPLAIAGLSSARISQQELREAIKDQEALVAADVSNFVAMRIGHLMDVLAAQSRILSGNPPSPRLLPGFLTLIYHQSDDFSAVFALDAAGKQLASIFQDTPPNDNLLGGHTVLAPEEVARAVAMVPVAEVLRNGSVAGPIFLRSPPAAKAPAADAHLVLAIRYQPRADQPALIFGALVGLRRIAQHMASLTSDGREIFLLDRTGRVVASGSGTGVPSFAQTALPALHGGAPPPRPQVVTTETGRMVFGAVAGVPAMGFGVLVERPFGQELSPMRRLALSTLFWIGVSGCVAALIGGALARSLSGRVGALAQGARQIAQGKLDTKFEVDSKDELGELAKAFNAMTTSLGAARHEILRQTEEITAWNETLEKRVADKSTELRETQDLLLRSRSLAAIGSLGAGVAHEINNPLTGILGLAQLLLVDLPENHPARPLVKDVEEQALRIESIVTNLLRLAQRQANEDQRMIDLAAIVDDALELCGQKAFHDAGITVQRRIPSPSPPVRGNPAQMQAALIHLITNARNAMKVGGFLTLETSVPEAGLLRLKVADTGHGIDAEHLPRIFDPFFTTKTRRADTGIGLSVVHKIIEDHGGTIRVESQPGHGHHLRHHAADRGRGGAPGMRLREARARFGPSFALGLGVVAVLALATLISRRFIETPGSLSRPPALRAAAVFAPTLRGEVAGPHELDAVAGPRARDRASANPGPAVAAAAAAADAEVDPDQAPSGVPAHRPQPIPEELLLSLVYRAPLAANLDPPLAPARAHRPPSGARPPEPPPLEMIEEDLWQQR